MNEHAPLPNNHAMTTGPRPILLALLIACLLALFPSGNASAQLRLGQSAQNPDDPQISVEIGFAGAVWPNRWLPVTITLVGGAKAFDGTVTISYSQDDRTRTQIVRAVAATPGKISSFGALVNLPPSCSEINLSLRSRSGREVRNLVFKNFPDLERKELQLPPVAATGPMVLALGELGDPALGTVRALQDDESQHHALGVARPAIAFMHPSTLPPTWAALDSVLMVVTTGEASVGCDPRILAGVREWVSAGGRLVVLANGPGEGWRNWLTASPDQPVPISIAPARAIDTPVGLGEVLSLRPPLAVAPNPRNAAGTPPPATPSAERDYRYKPATSLAARRISLTPAGVQQGWNIDFPCEDDAEQGLVAEGPLGFGWVVVVGFNPQLVPSSILNDATARVWYDLLDTVLGDWRERKLAASIPNYMNDQFSTGGFTVSDFNAQAARQAVLDKISDVPTIGHSVFPILAAGMFVLAMLLGPVDALMLRKLRARQHSWATAVCWIGLAGIAAYFAPNMARSGNTRVNRLSVIDIMQTTADPSSPAPAWRTAVTGVFAGASMQLPFEGRLAGSWWKPSSAQQEYSWGRGPKMTPRKSVTNLQSTPDLTALAQSDDPWGGLGAAILGAGGNIPGPINFKLWTFHTFQDQARATTPLRAVVERKDVAALPVWTVELHGVPEGASVQSAALRVPGDPAQSWRLLNFQKGDGSLTATTADAGTPTTGLDMWSLPAQPSQSAPYYPGRYGNTHQPLRYSLPLLLPGPDRRDWVITQSLKRGRAVLYLVLSDMPPDVTLKTEADYRHTQICRLVVPVAGADQPATTENEEKAK